MPQIARGFFGGVDVALVSAVHFRNAQIAAFPQVNSQNSRIRIFCSFTPTSQVSTSPQK